MFFTSVSACAREYVSTFKLIFKYRQIRWRGAESVHNANEQIVQNKAEREQERGKDEQETN